ncbi:MAG: SigE family RNA polymerase sigma factor [Kineosporiaceae bacterium]
MSRRKGFDEFVVGCSPGLLRTAYHLTHDVGLAEDLLQSTLVRVWGAWRRIDGDPMPYARRVLVNTYVSSWRRRWRAEVPDEAAHEPSAAVVPDATRHRDDRDEMWTALGRLPRRQRAVLVLRYYEDLTEAQIAAVLDISVGTVKSQASRGLAKLRVDATLTPADVYEGR